MLKTACILQNVFSVSVFMSENRLDLRGTKEQWTGENCVK